MECRFWAGVGAAFEPVLEVVAMVLAWFVLVMAFEVVAAAGQQVFEVGFATSFGL